MNDERYCTLLIQEKKLVLLDESYRRLCVLTDLPYVLSGPVVNHATKTGHLRKKSVKIEPGKPLTIAFGIDRDSAARIYCYAKAANEAQKDQILQVAKFVAQMHSVKVASWKGMIERDQTGKVAQSLVNLATNPALSGRTNPKDPPSQSAKI